MRGCCGERTRNNDGLRPLPSSVGRAIAGVPFVNPRNSSVTWLSFQDLPRYRCAKILK